jgi:hypothetical protein
MAATFSDHPYAMSNANPASGTPPNPADPSSLFSPQRKSARIKQRVDEGRNLFETDSDFEYYFLPGRGIRKDQTTPVSSDAEKPVASPAPSNASTSDTPPQTQAPSSGAGGSTLKKAPKRLV